MIIQGRGKKMLHELRFYEIVAGRVTDYVNHAGAVAVPFRGNRYGTLLGFWSCEIGAVNCVFNLWEYESVARLAKVAREANVKLD